MMKQVGLTLVCVVFLVAFLIVASASCHADIAFWNNGMPEGTSQRPDANVPCCGSTGWTVYDDFTVTNSITTITGFGYMDYLYKGNWNEYVSTNWTLFYNSTDPFGTPLYSGTTVFTMAPQSDGAMLFSITGLHISAMPGHWFLGLQNNFSTQDDWSTRAYASGNGLPNFWLQDNTGRYQVIYEPLDTAFTVSGTAVPEPSFAMLMGLALLGAVGFRRYMS